MQRPEGRRMGQEEDVCTLSYSLNFGFTRQGRIWVNSYFAQVGFDSRPMKTVTQSKQNHFLSIEGTILQIQMWSYGGLMRKRIKMCCPIELLSLLVCQSSSVLFWLCAVSDLKRVM